MADFYDQFDPDKKAGMTHPARQQSRLPANFFDQFDPNATKPEPPPGVVETWAIGAGRTFDQLYQGGKQAYLALRAEMGDQDAAKQLETLKVEQDENSRIYGELRKQRPFATGFGEALPALAMPMTGAGVVGSIVRPALGMGAIGAAQYGTPEERAKRGGVDALFGAAGGALGQGMSRLIRPVVNTLPPEQRAAQSAAEAAGFQFTSGQRTGSPALQSFDDMLARNLGGSGTYRKIADANQANANRIAQDATGAPSLTREALNANMERLRQGYEAFDASLTVPLGPSVSRALDSAEQLLGKGPKSLLSGQPKQVIDEMRQLVAGGQIPGDVYQIWRSNLNTAAFKTENATAKAVYKQLQKALDDAAVAAGGPERALLDKQYRAMKTLLRGNVVNEVTGDVNPALLRQALNVTGKESQKMTGNSPLTPIADFVKAAQPLKPGSPTQERLLTQMMTNPLGALVGAPIVAGNYVAAKALNSPGVANYLQNGMLRNPQVSDQTAELLARLGLLGGAGSGQGLLSASFASP